MASAGGLSWVAPVVTLAPPSPFIEDRGPGGLCRAPRWRRGVPSGVCGATSLLARRQPWKRTLAFSCRRPPHPKSVGLQEPLGARTGGRGGLPLPLRGCRRALRGCAFCAPVVGRAVLGCCWRRGEEPGAGATQACCPGPGALLQQAAMCNRGSPIPKIWRTPACKVGTRVSARREDHQTMPMSLTAGSAPSPVRISRGHWC